MTYKETSVLISVAVFVLVFGSYLRWGGKGTHKRDRAPLFRSQDGALDWQAAEPLPPLPPFPGDEPQETAPAFLPAPAERPVPDYVLAAIGHGGDSDAWLESAWNRVQARQLLELLDAGAGAR